ncbi:MATE family efflux transporter [Fundicoccus culcitae]|uniref:MATE family efflux transporter n=1 Tax=Fundicoccus culcitae TaxID=2969821 RepID=A0ABY5P5U6_9LACT|nr:MATE family efflux transporter [Fundicoccus culcitae]UUX33750.1 MATE family efflux transporter [Fundicoccus culcitae]
MNYEVKSTYQRFISLFLPLMVEHIFIMLIGNVNVVLLSYYDDTAVTVTGIADQLLSIGTMAMGIVSLGSTILFLQNAEKEKLNYVQGVARQTLVLNISLGLFLFAVAAFAGEYLITMMQTPSNLSDLTNQYLRIMSFSLLFQGITSSVSALLRSFGQVKYAMFLSILNTIISIIGNALVILTPWNLLGGGVIGVANATVMTRLIGAALSGYAVYRYLPMIWKNLFTFKIEELSIIKQILALGIPSGMENVAYNIYQTIITAIITSMGAASLNAKIYTQTATAVVFTLSVAAGQALQILLGEFLRQNDTGKVKYFAKRITLAFVLIGAIINIIIALLGPFVINIFTTDPAIIELMRVLLWLNVLYDPLRSANEILIASLQVTGDVRYPVIVGIVVIYLITIPFSFLFGSVLGLGLIAVWWIFILDEGIRAFSMYRRLNGNQWVGRYMKEGVVNE